MSTIKSKSCCGIHGQIYYSDCPECRETIRLRVANANFTAARSTLSDADYNDVQTLRATVQHWHDECANTATRVIAALDRLLARRK